MNITDNLSTEAVRAMAQLRRLLQPEVQATFKLSQNDDVLKMLKCADLSDNDAVTEMLDYFLGALDTDKRRALADQEVTGSLPPVSDKAKPSETAVNEDGKLSKYRKRFSWGQNVTD